MMPVGTVTQAAAAPPTSPQTLKNACQQFEGYFLNMMFQEMRKTVPQDSLLGDQDNQQQIFTGMMDQTLADAMSKRGDLGISQMLYDQLAPSLGAVPEDAETTAMEAMLEPIAPGGPLVAREAASLLRKSSQTDNKKQVLRIWR